MMMRVILSSWLFSSLYLGHAPPVDYLSPHSHEYCDAVAGSAEQLRRGALLFRVFLPWWFRCLNNKRIKDTK